MNIRVKNNGKKSMEVKQRILTGQNKILIIIKIRLSCSINSI